MLQEILFGIDIFAGVCAYPAFYYHRFRSVDRLQVFKGKGMGIDRILCQLSKTLRRYYLIPWDRKTGYHSIMEFTVIHVGPCFFIKALDQCLCGLSQIIPQFIRHPLFISDKRIEIRVLCPDP